MKDIAKIIVNCSTHREIKLIISRTIKDVLSDKINGMLDLIRHKYSIRIINAVIYIWYIYALGQGGVSCTNIRSL